MMINSRGGGKPSFVWPTSLAAIQFLVRQSRNQQSRGTLPSQRQSKHAAWPRRRWQALYTRPNNGTACQV